MSSWSEISAEIGQLQAAGDPAAADTVRRRYLAQLAAYTQRDTILYASRFIQPGMHISDVESIIDEDVQALIEVLIGLKSRKLDIILHSPGGSAEATESIVKLLRGRYKDIRVIVPQIAMSAATMWACAADRIVMGAQSSLGPIDPQMRIRGEGGVVDFVPAQAILDQFERAKYECLNRSSLPAWIPILRQYAPALLVQCENAQALSEELVKTWLRRYMLARTKYAARDARRIGRALSEHGRFRSHSRHIDRDWARSVGGRSVGLHVDDLEKDPKLEGFVMSVFHATMIVFSNVPLVAKIVENQNGRAFVKIAGAGQIVRRPSGAAPPPGLPPPPPGPGSAPAPLPTGPTHP
ncbi:MAG TPA: serine protease [Thermoplasmata archaeon]|nr:serine protease [Thermoplasmata archaeon]